jgi:hypothetical protein
VKKIIIYGIFFASILVGAALATASKKSPLLKDQVLQFYSENSLQNAKSKDQKFPENKLKALARKTFIKSKKDLDCVENKECPVTFVDQVQGQPVLRMIHTTRSLHDVQIFSVDGQTILASCHHSKESIEDVTSGPVQSGVNDQKPVQSAKIDYCQLK